MDVRAVRQALVRRRPGALGTALLVPTWVVLGVALVVYVVAMLALAFAAVVVHTARLLFGPPLRLLQRNTSPERVAGSA